VLWFTNFDGQFYQSVVEQRLQKAAGVINCVS